MSVMNFTIAGKRLHVTLAALLLLLLVGCSGLQTAAIDQGKAQSRTLSMVIQTSPNFLAITPDNDLFNRSGGYDRAIADGQLLVRENEIADPAKNITKMLAEAIHEKFGISYNQFSLAKTSAKDMGSLVHLANGRDYLLHVATVEWLYSYDVENRSKYLVSYKVDTRLINVAAKKVLGKSSCSYNTKSAGEPLVSYEKLLANDAAYIKQTFSDATTFCVDKVANELF
jgi:hypothetical protein